MTLAEFLALDAEARLAHLSTLTAEQVAELFGQMSAEQLTELDGQLLDRFNELDTSGDLTADTLDAMAALADCRDVVQTRQGELTAEQEAAETRAAELRERMTPTATETTPEGGEGGEGTSGGEGGGEGTSDGEGGGEGTSTGSEPAGSEASPEAVAAAGATTTRPGAASGATRRGGLQAMATRARSTQAQPDSTPRARVQLRAAERFGPMRIGDTLDVERLGQAMAEAVRQSREVPSGRFTVATGTWLEAYGDRRLREGSVTDNDRLIDQFTTREAMTAAAEEFLATNPSDADAIVAAGGGFCAPFPVDYEIPVEGSLARPIRDALARFGADRGGIQFTPPPALMSGTAAGVGVWDSTADEGVTVNADGSYTSVAGTKPIVEFDCLDPVSEQVEAITLRASFGNFNARFNPEQVGAHTRLSMVAHARFAEARLLGKLWSRADFRVTTPQLLGAARDWFAMLDGLLPAIRYRRRLDRDAPMSVIAPAWLRDMFRADMVRQMPTDNQDAAMALADARLLAWARARNANISWALDDRDDTTAYGRTQPTLAADGTGTAVLLDFPDTVESYVFPTGAVQFLDGGTLDLGVVRDARTNAVNRYETFAETWEGVAKRGTPLYAVRSTLSPTGTASALTAIGTADL